MKYIYTFFNVAYFNSNRIINDKEFREIKYMQTNKPKKHVLI